VKFSFYIGAEGLENSKQSLLEIVYKVRDVTQALQS